MNVASRTRQLRGLSICTGALAGLERAWCSVFPDTRFFLHCERELSSARILAARMEDGSLEPAPIWSDARTLLAELRRMFGDVRGLFDVITAGFPCQDISLAGNREGLAGERSGLWYTIAELIREVGPAFVLLENVRGLLTPVCAETPAPIATVLGDLADCGYDAQWLMLGADDVGASHRRDRVFIFAVRRDSGVGHADA